MRPEGPLSQGPYQDENSDAHAGYIYEIVLHFRDCVHGRRAASVDDVTDDVWETVA